MADQGLTQAERDRLADALLEFADGVQENLDTDADIEADADEPGEAGSYPVVEDYQQDADRIRMGERPADAETWEVLRDASGPAASTDDPEAFLALVERLAAQEEAT